MSLAAFPPGGVHKGNQKENETGDRDPGDTEDRAARADKKIIRYDKYIYI